MRHTKAQLRQTLDEAMSLVERLKDYNRTVSNQNTELRAERRELEADLAAARQFRQDKTWKGTERVSNKDEYATYIYRDRWVRQTEFLTPEGWRSRGDWTEEVQPTFTLTGLIMREMERATELEDTVVEEAGEYFKEAFCEIFIPKVEGHECE